MIKLGVDNQDKGFENYVSLVDFICKVDEFEIMKIFLIFLVIICISQIIGFVVFIMFDVLVVGFLKENVCVFGFF